MKLSDYIANFIASQNVRHVFTLPGGFSMHLNDSIHHQGQIEPVYCLHESGAGAAADSYAKYAGLGVCVVTAGPGATNAITACASAYCDSVPLLFISGQCKREDLSGGWVRCSGPQEVPITRMIAPVTKYHWLLEKPEEVAYILEKAVYIATHGRKGPVWIDIPLDVQGAEIDEAALEHFTPAIEPVVKGLAREVVPLLRESKRPLFLIGAGALGARSDIAKLIDLLDVPVLTTWLAKDMFAHDDPLLVGQPGPLATRAANFALQTCDLLVCIGARIDSTMTAWQPEHFAPNAKVVLVDIDPAELNHSPVADVKIEMDAGKFAREIVKEIEVSGHPDISNVANWSHWRGRCSLWKAHYHITTDTPVYQTIRELSGLLTPDDVIVIASSSVCCGVFYTTFKQKLGQRIYYSNGQGSLGYDIPYAIGACLASGGRRTICLAGEGGFMQNIQELEVVRRLNLPIKFFVFDNNGYSSIRLSQQAHMKRLSGADEDSGMTIPNIRSVADAFEIESCVIDRYMDTMLDKPGPTLFVVPCSQDERCEPRVLARMGADGKMVSGTLENLYPYLPPDELARELSNAS